MAKSIAQKLANSKFYKTEFGDRELSESELVELEKFNQNVGFTHDRIRTLVLFIKQKYIDWDKKWAIAKSLASGDLAMQVLLYGEEDGTRRYSAMNAIKISKLDHSPATQLRRARKSAEISKGSKTHSIRSIGYWLKKGLAHDVAAEKVRDLQSTNTVNKYIKKYGEELGRSKFNKRKILWAEKMHTSERNKKKSLGLWRYVERYGDVDGKIKYLEMRKKRNEKSSIGKASAESVIAFDEIIRILDQNNIAYYFGVAGNKEWFIYDKLLERPFFYDLVIPSLSIIMEYHGEAYHPNPRLEKSQWSAWHSLFTNKSADDVYHVDQYKKKLAESAGWTVFEMYSSEVISTRRVLIEHLARLGYVL
jgi:hypothetical protein